MINYKETLNLPHTDFSMRANLAENEPKMLDFWQRIDIYQTLRKHRKNKPNYILHDGPPYANGEIHMGHALNKVLKDIIVKYKFMSGFDVPFVPGWDCHGLPIEQKVLQSMQEEKSPSNIRKRCFEYAMHYVDVQKAQFRRLGIFGDWENPYLTLDKEYTLSVVELLLFLAKRGDIYRSLKPVFWCPKCKTALAEAELEYTKRYSPSIVVKFPILSEDFPSNSYILIWTTTPWTLPGNVAIALHPTGHYCLCKTKSHNNVVVASGLIDKVLGDEFVEKLREFEGSSVEGLTCKHPFLERNVVVVTDRGVNLAEGSGCVHIAPGHGLEDFEIGLRYNLQIISPIDADGRFTNFTELEQLNGLDITEAQEKIIQILTDTNLLFSADKILHSYPHCWRCTSPLLMRATWQWFINIKNLIPKALQMAERIYWIPESSKERFIKTVSARSDWCISRQRVWGVPLPLIYCKACNKPVVDQSIIERIVKIFQDGKEAWFSAEISDIMPRGYICLNCFTAEFEKENDIVDVWFESGASFSCILMKRNELNFPADLYLEGTDQHRGWFQATLLLSAATKNAVAFRSVLTHSFVLDEHGLAMHKSKGNVVSPDSIYNKFGADILRLWIGANNFAQDLRASEATFEYIGQIYRKIRNTFRFILANLYDFSKKDVTDKFTPLDRYILHKFQCLIGHVRASYQMCEFHKVVHLITNFCVNELSALYFDAVKDALYVEMADSVRRRAVQTLLYYIGQGLSQLLAPIISFTAEEFWQALPDKPTESVFLSNFPNVNSKYVDFVIEKAFSIVLEIREKFLKKLELARQAKRISTSLQAKVIVDLEPRVYNYLVEYIDLETIRETLIVSQVFLEKGRRLKVDILLADGSKCARCWMYSPQVGKNEEYKDICLRCIKVVSQYKPKVVSLTLTQKDIDNYRQELLRLYSQYSLELEQMRGEYLEGISQQKDVIDFSGYSPHLADVASEVYEHEKNVGLLENVNNLLREIDYAIQKIDEGRFGYCEECQKMIDKLRLDVVPYTRLCIDCQRKKS